MIPDIEELLKTYADWIAWLRAKRAELETQRAKLKTTSDGTATAEGIPENPVTPVPDGPVEAQPAPRDAPVPVAVPGDAPAPAASQEEDIPDWL